ncbi:hydrogenase expression/formation protein HypC [Marinobacterium halophilum]|uniref:Hydrogenase expression/formation protein HypC n=1 Tax=Marinobacterium halophilum TaxID=267374 RepID=A0A2P8END8_9GAMM|nr:HypC/HybG/HupF family hydrogenase formation chaperone [Marinobacterium halophilum]PSL10962.1 hydrogenase expression/formation protein HypC [Marinobacterium halophilum]
MCLGIPGEIVAIDDAATLTAVVEVSGVRRRVNLACVLPTGADPASLLGYWVLVHVGFAMSLIDAEEAHQTLRLLAELEAFADEVR